MNLARVFATCLACWLATPVAAQTQAPTDAAIEQVLATWQQTRKRSLDGKPDPAAAAALGELDLAQATVPQLERLCAAMLPQTADTAVKDRCRTRLHELASDPTVDGAVAATRLVELIDRGAADAPRDAAADLKRQRIDAIVAAARHPGFGDAIAAGRATSLYLQVYFLRDPAAVAQAGIVALLLPHVTPQWLPLRVRDLLAFQETAADDAGDLGDKTREHLRVTCLAVLERALASEQIEPNERRYLERRGEHLRGAAARGQLVGQPAPAIDFLWSNANPAPKSFADLRGRIVVVDFWATWCGPCVASFPHLRELAQRYHDLPVVVLGVTSLQGYVSYPKAAAGQPRRVETKDPEQELARLGPWCEQMEVTWTVAVSRQDCFNPDFGVRGIPHVAILDADGRVRWNGLPSGGSTVEDRIDALLAEMGREPPKRAGAKAPAR